MRYSGGPGKQAKPRTAIRYGTTTGGIHIPSEESVVCEFNSKNVNKNYYFKAGECKSLVSVMSK